jgi:hypothetical protein
MFRSIGGHARISPFSIGQYDLSSAFRCFIVSLTRFSQSKPILGRNVDVIVTRSQTSVGKETDTVSAGIFWMEAEQLERNIR